MNPRPTQQSYFEFYRTVFWEQKIKNIGFHKPGQIWGGGKYKWDNSREWGWVEGVNTIKDKLRELRVGTIVGALSEFIKLDEDADVLEVGAGIGVTLREIKDNYGCAVYAIEPSQEAQKLIENMDVRIIGDKAEDLEELGKLNTKFDGIIFSHSLENTVYPLDIIRWSKTCLKTGGVIYVQCSNLYTFDQMNPYHPYIFSEHSLSLIAEKSGLISERIDKDHTHRMLTMVFRKA